MALSHEQKEDIFKKINDVVLMGIDTGALEEYELSDIAAYALKRTGELEGEGEISVFFQELSDRWPIFNSLLDEEEHKAHERVENEVSEGASMLLQHGKVEEALALVKTATAN